MAQPATISPRISLRPTQLETQPSPRPTRPYGDPSERIAPRPPNVPHIVEPTVEEEEEVLLVDDDNVESNTRIQQRQPRRMPEVANKLTKNGTLDRRLKGQRDLPEEDVRNPNYRKPFVGGTDQRGVHITKTGKPDRRFLENRTISPEEAELRMAEHILGKYQDKQTSH